METVQPEPRRFYDGGVLAIGDRIGLPPDAGAEPRIVLERHLEDSLETFSMERRLAYLDRDLGEIIVPASPDFRTDLTSTPAIFTWVVPKTGAHLPAALVHDALVAGGGEASSYTSTSYTSTSYTSAQGFTIDRVQADRVLRDAMADTGTGIVRRWIVWSAVTAATIFVPGGLPRSSAWPPSLRWSHRAGAAASLAVIAYLGYCATGDLFDCHWPLAWRVPWMGEGPWWSEFLGGLVGAIVIPLALSPLWGRFWRAGAINCVVLALLLHVSMALGLISIGYQLAERLARRAPRLALALTLAVGLAALAGFASFTLG